MSPPPPIDIGEAARRLGVSAATLRLYERRGLLPKAPRSAGGYRKYSAEDLRRARLVRRARRLGLSMQQISRALEGGTDTATLRRMMRAHLACIERELKRVARLRRHLCRWLARGDG